MTTATSIANTNAHDDYGKPADPHTPVPFIVVVYRVGDGPPHLPASSAAPRLSRCGAILLARATRGELAPLEQVCPRCATERGSP